MLYKQFQDLSLSLLGMGNMRLPKLEGKGEAVDKEWRGIKIKVVGT
jgi:predicted aldo/keto reductase-like oxidoreductase